MISVTQTDVEIHPQLAGIGDIVLQKNSGNVQTTLSDIKILKGSTYSSGISGYHVYGVIYGFEKGCAMVMARTEESKKWADNSSGTLADNDEAGAIVAGTTTATAGKPRNNNLSGAGNQGYLAMNVRRIKESTSGSISTLLHPKRISVPAWGTYTDIQMSEENFEADTNGAKTMYKTYENYLRQVMPMGNGGGGVFDLKYHVGKDNTRILAQYYDTSHLDAQERWYPAATYCYNYYPTGGASRVGEWWLPDMVELLQMMKDETNDLINVSLGKCGSQCLASAARWSSIRRNAADAWFSYFFGFSISNYFRYPYKARPVTLLKLY